jgi:predicted dehydrogenase
MRILIVGLGSVGRRHLRNLLALGQTDLVLLRSGKSTLPEEDLQGYPVVRDVEAALCTRPQAAVIATPTSLHLQPAIPLARAGVHLLLEKPVSHSLEGVQGLRDAAAQGGAQVMVAYMYRQHPGLQAVRGWLAEGTIGRPLVAQAHYGDYLPGWHPWEDYRTSYSARSDLGGGVVLTLCHPLDYLLWLLGDVDQVSAMTASTAGFGIDVEDSAQAAVRFASGALGDVHLNYVQRPASHHLTILGTEGTLTWDQSDGAARLFRAAAGAWDVCEAPAGYERNDMFVAEAKAFLEVAAGRSGPEPSLEDGIRSLELALAIRESARQGRSVDLKRRS